MVDGSEERHVKAGSRLSLVCRVHDASGPPSYVFWYRDDVVVNYSERKGIHIWTGDAVPKDVDKFNDDTIEEHDVNATTTVKSTTMSDGIDKTASATEVYSRQSGTATARPKTSRRKTRIRPLVVSMLEIQMVMPDDAGTYTCAPSNAKNHSVVVHVIQGKTLNLYPRCITTFIFVNN
jgi:hypothetical protein